ncbi:MAG TPA: TRIC cation channel family protein [Alphaproteobacteria bacterium]|nr:TRIC cation channel family protein [Alphaproteobacteria bacterium]
MPFARRLAATLAAAVVVLLAGMTWNHPVAAQDAPAQKRVLRSGWYLWDPYQFQETRASELRLTGLDIELTRAIAETAGYGVSYEYVGWSQHLADLRAGDRDMAAGANYTPERAAFYHYSVPYRTETNVLYLPPGASSRYKIGDVPALLTLLQSGSFRLGVIKGYLYGDDTLDAFIADPANGDKFVMVDNDYDNFRNLVDKKTDGFLVDRIVGATTAWRGNWRKSVEEYPRLQLSHPIHLVFSKVSVAPEEVAVINQAIAKLQDSGAFSRIVSNYMFPILLAQTLDRDWFFIIDIIGTIAFAISGVVLAYRGHYSLFGAMVLAVLPAVGGGIVRDLITGRSPIGVMASPLYMLVVIATVVAGYIVIRMLPRILHLQGGPDSLQTARGRRIFNAIVDLCDTLGLAAFTITGVVVAVATRVEPLWLWGPILAALTGAGGGVLRDIVRQDANIASLKGEFYPEVALIWGFLLSMFLIWQTRVIDPEQIFVGIIVTLVGAFLTRSAAIYFGIRSPIYR